MPLPSGRHHHGDALVAGLLAETRHDRRLVLLHRVVDVDADRVDLKQRDARVHAAPPALLLDDLAVEHADDPVGLAADRDVVGDDQEA